MGLSDLIAKYGWQAVVTELAQTALDHGDPTAADNLLQAACAPKRCVEMANHTLAIRPADLTHQVNQKAPPLNSRV